MSPVLFSRHPSQTLKRDIRKGDRFKADLSRREKGPASKLDNGKSSLLCFPCMKSRYGGKLIFFFSPLWEMSLSTVPWQFSNDGRLDTITCDTRKAWLRTFFPPEEYVSGNMSTWLQMQLRDQFGTPSALQHSAPETAPKEQFGGHWQKPNHNC